jgi:deoxycytidine triphosphate deaminase
MIAELIAGKRKPEKGRYIYTSGIDLWLSASEYFHDSKHMYTRQNRFHALVRTILGDTRIAGTLEELKVAHNRRMDEQGYSMPKRLFSMIANGGDPGFSTEHSARIYSEYYNTENANWIPDQNEIICAIIEEKMQQNWRMKLAGTSEKQFYFRPGATTPGVAIGNQVMICVTKGWIHQKRLYVSGKI